MTILLIQPKINKRPMDTDLKTRMAPSLALLTLLELTPEEHKVVLCNENIEKLNPKLRPDLVGITVTVDVLPRAAAIARRYRDLGVPVAAGGIHITCDPDSCLPHFDALCIGPAEHTWPRLLQDAAQGRLLKIYRDTEDLKGTDLVSPAYGRIDRRRYLYTNVVSTSRGCPNRCGFCYNSCQNRLHLRRPISDVLRDIEAVGTRHILFIDDNFIGDVHQCRLLLQSLRGRNLAWSAAVTSDVADHPGLLDLMAETGCQSLFIGFESINDASLQSVSKSGRRAVYERLISEIHRRGIMINASLVFGLDADGPDVFRRTLDWLIARKIETMTAHILTPYPGTVLHRQLSEAGRITDFDLSRYNTAHVVYRPLGMTEDELYAGYLWTYRHFYSLRNILRRLPEDKKARRGYLLFNLLYRKFGPLTAAISRLIPMNLLGRLSFRLTQKRERPYVLSPCERIQSTGHAKSVWDGRSKSSN